MQKGNPKVAQSHIINLNIPCILHCSYTVCRLQQSFSTARLYRKLAIQAFLYIIHLISSVFLRFFRINSCPFFTLLKLLLLGGPDGELAASLRYLSQRFTMPDSVTKGILNDIGTEELAHLEMVGSIVYQLTRDLNDKIVEESGFSDYFINHTTGIYPANTNGVPFTAAYIAVSGDPIADLNEDLAADGTTL